MFKKVAKLISSITITLGLLSVSAYAVPVVNHALDGIASQSSRAASYYNYSAASNVIDNNTYGNWQNSVSNSLNHTELEFQAWWQVDLGKIINIDEIVIWNRTDCCAERLNNFNVLLDGTVIYIYDDKDGPMPSLILSNLRLSGQVLRVQLNDTNALHLAEVQVFGSVGSLPQLPEPAPIALLGLGLFAVGLYRNKRL